MKVLAINGSPRKGNTLKLIKAVADILEKSQEIQVEIINLPDFNLQICKGCFQCLKNGSENCPLKDDRDLLIRKITDADGVIFASPVYVMQVTSIFKNMIDRFAFICHRPRFFNKPVMIISTTGAWGLKEVMKYMANIVRVWGFCVTAQLGLTTQTQDFSLDRYRKEIELSTLKFYNLIIHKDKIKPSTMQVVQFYAQRKIFGDPKLKEILPRDYRFFNHEVGKNYFTDSIKVGLGKQILGWLISKTIRI